MKPALPANTKPHDTQDLSAQFILLCKQCQRKFPRRRRTIWSVLRCLLLTISYYDIITKTFSYAAKIKASHSRQRNISRMCSRTLSVKIIQLFPLPNFNVIGAGVWLKPQNRQSWYFAYKFTLPSILVLGPKSSIIWQFFLQIFVGLIES